MDVVELLNRNGRKFPDKPAIISDTRNLTYREFCEESNRIANYLVRHGVKKGDKVSLLTLNIPEYLTTFFGIMKAGGVVVPINYKSQAPEIRFIVEHSDSVALVYEDALAASVVKGIEGLKKLATVVSTAKEPAAGHTAFSEITASSSPDDPGIAISPDDECEIIYTSGTTGDPKGCVLTHHNCVISCLTAAIGFSMNLNSRTLHAMPLFHSAPLNLLMVGTMFCGGTHVLLREYNPQLFLKSIRDHAITHLFAAPVAMLFPLMMPDFDSYDLTSMKLWVYGGGPISRGNAELLMKKYKTNNLMQVYGLSECGPNGSCLLPEDQVSKAGSIGYCGAINSHMRVIGERGNDVGVDEIGEIIVWSESNMKEYYKNPSATAQTLRDGWVFTGDLAKMDGDGYFYIVDRKKDMIVAGGENVYTKEVEDVMLQIPEIAQVAVFGIPNAEWGETIVAAVVLKPDQVKSSDEIKLFMKDKIAKFKIPREVFVRDSLPVTPTGKIQKYLLKTEYGK